MRSFADIRRLTLARRLAAGMPAWAVARASNIPLEELEALVVEQGFAELVDSMAELMAMDEEARLAKLYRIAQEILAASVVAGDERACEFMVRQTELRRNPHQVLQRGLNATIKGEIHKAERLRAEIEAGRLTPETPVPEPPPAFDFSKQPETLAEAIAACEAAAALPADRFVDPIDARLYRKAGALRREMLREEALYHAAAEQEAAERRKVPLELDEVDAIEARQVAAFAARQAAEAASCEADEAAPVEESDAAFQARALAMLEATLAQAPPHLRPLLATFSQDELEALLATCWPKDESEAQPQGP